MRGYRNRIAILIEVIYYARRLTRIHPARWQKRVKKERENSKEITAGSSHSGLEQRQDVGLIKTWRRGYLELKLRTIAWHVLVAQDTRRGPEGWCFYGYLWEGSMRLFLWVLERQKKQMQLLLQKKLLPPGWWRDNHKNRRMKRRSKSILLPAKRWSVQSQSYHHKAEPSDAERWKWIACPRKVMRRRQWHPTPVLLPGKSHGWRSLVGYSPWGCTESDTTEAT